MKKIPQLAPRLGRSRARYLEADIRAWVASGNRRHVNPRRLTKIRGRDQYRLLSPVWDEWLSGDPDNPNPDPEFGWHEHHAEEIHVVGSLDEVADWIEENEEDGYVVFARL